MTGLFSSDTLHIKFPFGKSILIALVLIPVIIAAMELALLWVPVPETVLLPTLDGNISYPEIDIKLFRMGFWDDTQNVNCLIMGSSMVDYGFDPSTLDGKEGFAGLKEPHCFNMALRGMRPKTNSSVAAILQKRVKPKIILLGLSPIDFAGEVQTIGNYNSSPWFQYQFGNTSFQGWLIDNSRLYRYWLAFLKYRDPAYQNEMHNIRLLLNDRGLQIRQKSGDVFQVNPVLQIPNFTISPEDKKYLAKIAALNGDDVKVVVFEMPTNPDIMPYYVAGGVEGYERTFVEPVESVLKEYNIPFIRTQNEIEQVVPPEGWTDQLHMNDLGMRRFSVWFADKISAAD